MALVDSQKVKKIRQKIFTGFLPTFDSLRRESIE